MIEMFRTAGDCVGVMDACCVLNAHKHTHADVVNLISAVRVYDVITWGGAESSSSDVTVMIDHVNMINT